MTVGEVCTSFVLTAREGDTIVDAARRMRDAHVGSLVIVDERGTNKPIGILTDRDIVVRAVAQPPDTLESLLVGNVMTGDPVTVRRGDTLDVALASMRARGIRRLPVVSGDGHLVGLLAFDDILEVMSRELCQLVGLVAHEQKRERELRT